MTHLSTPSDVPLAGAAGSRRKGAFARALDRLVEARFREARRTVNGYLLTLDDQTLADLGYDRAVLLRQGATSRTPL